MISTLLAATNTRNIVPPEHWHKVVQYCHEIRSAKTNGLGKQPTKKKSGCDIKMKQWATAPKLACCPT